MGRPRKEVAEGVTRDEGFENPLEDNPVEKSPRASGVWKKVTREEMVNLEADGLLIGYDPSTGEVLVK